MFSWDINIGTMNVRGKSKNPVTNLLQLKNANKHRPIRSSVKKTLNGISGGSLFIVFNSGQKIFWNLFQLQIYFW
jgi:hypothetical protein